MFLLANKINFLLVNKKMYMNIDIPLNVLMPKPRNFTIYKYNTIFIINTIIEIKLRECNLIIDARKLTLFS